MEIDKYKKVFVVDDSILTAKLLTALLQKQGFNVSTFDNAKSALDNLDKIKPDIILSDYMMPEMNGFEFCKVIKGDSKTKHIKFIMVTALDDTDAKVRCFQAGADDYIVKPFNSEEIIARVSTHIRVKELQDSLQIALNSIERELEVVAEIQENLLPKSGPAFSNVIFESYYNTFDKSGGDYFDFINIDDKNTGVLIADVSGHGTSSTVIMVMLKIFFTKLLNKIRSPSMVFNKLNNLIIDMLNIDKFATIFYGILNVETFHFIYSNAAHPDPIIINKATKEALILKGKKSLPVGILPIATNTYSDNTFTFEENSRVILYTDGITEAKNSEGKLFGRDKLISIMQNSIDTSLSNAKNLILDELYKFTDKKFNDDLTFVMFDILK